MSPPLLDRAIALGEDLDRQATVAASVLMAHDQHGHELRDLAEKLDALEGEARAIADVLAQPPPANGPWGRGKVSGLPWLSGMAWRGNMPGMEAFVAGPRAGRGLDCLQLFGPSNIALVNAWDLLAGGPGDSPETAQGALTWTSGSRQGEVLWGLPVTRALPIVYTLRAVPIDPAVTNEDGRRPETWLEIAQGQRDDVWRRLGMRFAFQDQKAGRTAPLILEFCHEMSGAWYPHSIHGKLPDGRWCYEVFPTAWAKIVDGIREGYLRQARQHCHYRFLFRPARCALPNGVRMDRYLPCPSTWDAVGTTQHDNAPYSTAANPRACWTPGVKNGLVEMEGLELVAELAQKYGKCVAVAEWSPYPTDSTAFKSGPESGLFVQALWDFFLTHSELIGLECYFEREASSMTSRPDWTATQAYRRLWGAQI